jgi:hypothetical protein
MNQTILDRIYAWRDSARNSMAQWLFRTKPEVVSCWLALKVGAVNAYTSARTRMMCPKRLDIVFVITLFLLLILDLLFRVHERLEINTFYYTFSTISQSLASAFAFLVAVALYRMQTIENEMETALGEVIQHAVHGKDQSFLMRKNRCRSWEDMDQYIRQEHVDTIPGDEVKSLMSSNFRFFNQGRAAVENLKTELVRALQLTSVVIASSITLIPISQLLHKRADHTNFFMGQFISMFILYTLLFLTFRCLWFYWDIAKHLTDRKPRDVYAICEATLGATAVLGTASVRTESR